MGRAAGVAPGAAAATTAVTRPGAFVMTYALVTEGPDAANLSVSDVDADCSSRTPALSDSKRGMGQIVVPAAFAIERSVTVGVEPPVVAESLFAMVIASVLMALKLEMVAVSTLATSNENWTTATHAAELVEPAGAVVPDAHAIHAPDERY